MNNDLSAYRQAVLRNDALREKFAEACETLDVKPQSQKEWEVYWRMFEKGADAEATMNATKKAL